MRYLMAGGGTGGHITPALNIAHVLEKCDGEAKILFVGTVRGLERSMVPDAGYNIEFIEAHPWRGFGSLIKLLKSTKQVKAIIKDFKADAIVGTGGYVSAPAVLGAVLSKTALFIQEQNTYPGLASRLGSLFARRVFLGFPDAIEKLWRRRNVIMSGNPVFPFELSEEKENARRKLGLEPEMKTVFLTGGSQGASAMNEMVKLMLESKGLPVNVQLLWQCGEKEYEALTEWLKGEDYPVSLHPFIHNMELAYRAADIGIEKKYSSNNKSEYNLTKQLRCCA